MFVSLSVWNCNPIHDGSNGEKTETAGACSSSPTTSNTLTSSVTIFVHHSTIATILWCRFDFTPALLVRLGVCTPTRSLYLAGRLIVVRYCLAALHLHFITVVMALRGGASPEWWTSSRRRVHHHQAPSNPTELVATPSINKPRWSAWNSCCYLSPDTYHSHPMARLLRHRGKGEREKQQNYHHR